jgi:hypothetical protein
MKKIATFASAAALSVASLSANAWRGTPYGPCGMTKEQQQAMMEQQAKVIEQMTAARRKMAEQMAAQHAQMIKQMQEKPMDPMTMSVPGAGDPWGDMGPWADMGPWDLANPWSDMSAPEFPTMPEMPSIGQMPEYPTMPEMYEPFGPSATDMPQPSLPPVMQGRYSDLEAYRAKVLEESKARREEAMKKMTERRKEILANRYAHPHRYSHPFAHPYSEMFEAPEMPAVPLQVAPKTEPTAPNAPAAPAVKSGPSPVAEASP